MITLYRESLNLVSYKSDLNRIHSAAPNYLRISNDANDCLTMGASTLCLSRLSQDATAGATATCMSENHSSSSLAVVGPANGRFAEPVQHCDLGRDGRKTSKGREEPQLRNRSF